MKLTEPKREAFVQGLFRGLSQRKAYIEAEYSTKSKSDNYIDKKACELYKNEKVRGRLDELQDKVANDNLWSKERLIDAFEDNYNESKGSGDIRVSNDSLKEIGKLCGHYVEKVELSEKMPNIILKK